MKSLAINIMNISPVRFLLKRFLGNGERTKGVFSGSVIMVVSTLISTLARVGLISVLARIYTKDQFGVWVTITSATAVMAASDFGIGNALRNKLSELRAKQDKQSDNEAREYFLSVIYFFLFLAFLFSFLLLVFHNQIPFDHFFKTDNQTLKGEISTILVAVQIIYLINIPLGIGASMFFAYQESFWVGFFNVLIALSTIVIIGILALMGKSIVMVSILFFVISLIFSTVATGYFLYRRKWKLFQINYKLLLPRVLSLLSMSFVFAVLQIALVFIYNATTMVVTAKISLSDAAELNLVQKLYTFAITIYTSLYYPLWAGYSDAVHRQDWNWAKKTLKRSTVSTILLFGLLILVFSVFGNFFLKLLGGKGYSSSSALFVFLGAWALFYSLFALVIAFISATGKIIPITICTAVVAFSFVSISDYFISLWGTLGTAVWAAIAFVLLACLSYLHVFYIFRRAKRQLLPVLR